MNKASGGGLHSWNLKFLSILFVFGVIFLFCLPGIVSAATTITVGIFPASSTLSGNNLYVNNYETDNVSVIDVRTNAVIATITVGDAPITSPLSGTKLYVANSAGD